MSHYDDVTLALLALGEIDASADSGAHLAECSACRTEVASLAVIADTGRRVVAGDAPVSPSPEVWDRIVADVRRDDAAHDLHDERLEPADAGSAAVIDLDQARPVRRAPRRFGGIAAAAAVGLVVGSGATYLAARTTQSPAASDQAAVRVAALAPYDDPTASGQAVLRVSTPAQRTVTVNVKGLPSAPGMFYEVWLMDPKTSGLVAIGVLDSRGQGDFVVPAGLDLTAYSAIDVSQQPMNGSPLHSKNSAVRGSIAT